MAGVKLRHQVAWLVWLLVVAAVWCWRVVTGAADAWSEPRR